jgi:hypothetical protein
MHALTVRWKRLKIISRIQITVFTAWFSVTLVNDPDHAMLFRCPVRYNFVDPAHLQIKQGFLLERGTWWLQIRLIVDTLCVAHEILSKSYTLDPTDVV